MLCDLVCTFFFIFLISRSFYAGIPVSSWSAIVAVSMVNGILSLFSMDTFVLRKQFHHMWGNNLYFGAYVLATMNFLYAVFANVDAHFLLEQYGATHMFQTGSPEYFSMLNTFIWMGICWLLISLLVFSLMISGDTRLMYVYNRAALFMLTANLFVNAVIIIPLLIGAHQNTAYNKLRNCLFGKWFCWVAQILPHAYALLSRDLLIGEELHARLPKSVFTQETECAEAKSEAKKKR